MERDVLASELKFYIPEQLSTEAWSAHQDEAAEAGERYNGSTNDSANFSTKGLQRVFIDPSSVNFRNTSYQRSNFLLYGTRYMQTVGTQEAKLVLRDITEVAAFPLLFFGGSLEAQYLAGTITIDGWIRCDGHELCLS